MLHKISFGLLRGSDRQRARSEALPRPSSPLDFDDRDPFAVRYQGTTLEALDLDPLVAPTLTPMRPMTVSREAAMHWGGRQPGQSMGDHVRSEMGRRPSAMLELATQTMGVALLPMPMESPKDEVDNPFDGEANPFRVTALPKRPEVARRAVSARTRRDMPLRVQALRRSHQQAFAQSLMQRITEETTTWSRRVSDEEEEEIEPQAAEPDPFAPSALLQRRQQRPQDQTTPSLRLPAFNEPDLFFAQPDDQGHLQPYDMRQPSRPSSGQSVEYTPPRPQTPRTYVDGQGRPWV